MIAVFGGTGVLGRQVVASQRPMRGGDCPESRPRPARQLLDPGTLVVPGDLCDGAVRRPRVDGRPSCRVHCAWWQRSGGDGPRGLEGRAIPRLIEAAAQTRVERFVYVSTASASATTPVSFFGLKHAVEQRPRGAGLSFLDSRARLIS